MTAATTIEITESRALSGKPTGPRELEVQLITPGWGSSGYYSADVLEQAVKDRVFAAGTHMYADHPTATEDAERPGRSIRDLAAVLVEDARLDGAGGLVGRAKPLNGWGPVLAEMADSIGVSIRADAYASAGEADGRTGLVVEKFTRAKSVDFVTKAGRGGRILELLESARTADPAPVPLPAAATTARPEVLTVNRTDLRAAIREALTEDRNGTTPHDVTADAPSPAPTPDPVEESVGTTPTGDKPGEAGQAEVNEAATRTPVSEAARLNRLLEEEHAAHGRALVRAEEAEKRAEVAEGEVRLLKARWDAEGRAKAALAASPLKEASYAAVIADVCDGLALDDHGQVSEAAVDAAIKAAIDKEATKVAALLEQHGVGLPSGLGSGTSGQTTQLTEAAFEAQFTQLLGRAGVDDDTAKLAARGRN